MPIEVLMPALSPTMEEGTLAKWLVKEGDTVSSGDLIAEIETDKATMEFEAVDEGVVGKIVVPEGSEGVKVNSLIAVLLEDGESADDIATGATAAPAAAAAEAAPAAVEAAASAPAAAPAPAAPAAADGSRIFASPLARRIAAQKGLDLSAIKGSGPKGRIIKVDVENATAAPKEAPKAAAPAPAAAAPRLRVLPPIWLQKCTKAATTRKSPSTVCARPSLPACPRPSRPSRISTCAATSSSTRS